MNEVHREKKLTSEQIQTELSNLELASERLKRQAQQVINLRRKSLILNEEFQKMQKKVSKKINELEKAINFLRDTATSENILEERIFEETEYPESRIEKVQSDLTVVRHLLEYFDVQFESLFQTEQAQ